MTTQNNNIRNQILIRLSEKLSTIGFKKKGNTFVRESEIGLYQIIDITLGPSWGTTANHVGVGFGIATEEWIDKLNNWKRPKVLSSSDCEIRDINCNLIPLNDSTNWYPISIEFSLLFSKIEKHLAQIIIPFLDKLKTRDKIIEMWREYKNNIGFAVGRHVLAIGVLMYLNHDKNEGKKILSELFLQKKDNEYFASVIEKTVEEISSSHSATPNV